MFKTIFRKQFFTFAFILLIIFFVLGAALLGMVRNYFYGQKQRTLTLQASRIAEGFINSRVMLRFPFSFFETPLEDQINILYSYLSASSFVCVFGHDTDDSGIEPSFMFLMGSHNLLHWQDDEEYVNAAINSVPEFMPARRGEVVTVIGTLNGIFDERMMIVGYPILHRNYIHGVVFMNSPITEIEANIRDVANIALICVLISAAVAFILVYFSSRTISNPIRMISGAAKVIADGNFDKRLDVKSRDEVGQLSESFNFMADSLESAESSRRAFISNISHDLRSPLTSVKGFIQAMLDGTIPTDNREKYLEIVLDETERVTKMANDLMYISQFQNFGVELNITEFDINELIRTTLITFERRILDKNLEIDISLADEKNIVRADYEKIQRVVYNLLDNAIKFNESGGAISVKTAIRAGQHARPCHASTTLGVFAERIQEGEPKKITISVKDSGPGISPDEQRKIFDRFFKTDRSRGLHKGGSGLGLAIVREFVRAHGESIQLSSSLGKGSEFWFNLPLAGR